MTVFYWGLKDSKTHLISRLVPIALPTKQYNSEEELAELAANLIEDTNGLSNTELIHSTLRNLLSSTSYENTIIDEVQLYI